jgi:pSer/pThr/pTyr-binding forkhead associated (FHA) protein
MSLTVLTITKFVLIGLLYLFVLALMRTARYELDAKPVSRRQVTRTPAQPGRLRLAENPKTVLPLTPPTVTLGRRADTASLIDDVYVSDEHAELRVDAGSWSVRDLGSTNGTYVNSVRITGPTTLAVGDTLRIGKTVFLVDA